MSSTVIIRSHSGPWTSLSRTNPTLAFLESYTAMIGALSLSGHKYHDFYAPSASFIDADGTVYEGGQVIWDWIHELFGPFEKLGVEGEHRLTVLEGRAVLEAGKGVAKEDGEDVEGREIRGDVVFFEHTMVFHFKGSEEGETVSARRMMEFVIGSAEEEGQGTSGLQIWRGKVWWDKGVVMSEAMRRGGRG